MGRDRTQTGSTRRSVGRVMGVLLLVAASGYGFYVLGGCVMDWVHESPLFSLRLVEVVGLETLSPDDVRALYPVEPGTQLFQVNVQAVGRAVGAHPRVRAARVTRVVPDRVRIHLVERLPAAQILAGAWYEIDEEGVVLGRVRPQFEHALPKFIGVRLGEPPVSGSRLEDDTTRRLLALVTALHRPPLKDRAFGRRMSVFMVSEDGGLAVPLGASSTTLLLGRERWVERLKKLGVVEAHATPPGAEPTQIDLRFDDMVVVGPTPSWGKDLAQASPGA